MLAWSIILVTRVSFSSCRDPNAKHRVSITFFLPHSLWKIIASSLNISPHFVDKFSNVGLYLSGGAFVRWPFRFASLTRLSIGSVANSNLAIIVCYHALIKSTTAYFFNGLFLSVFKHSPNNLIGLGTMLLTSPLYILMLTIRKNCIL